jgi:5'-3' exonuclease
MGIDSLPQWLKSFRTKISLKRIEGYRLAVDTSIYLYRYVRGSQIWTDRFIELVVALRRYNIKPVFIFDGKAIPEEKVAESNRRRNTEVMSRDTLKWLKSISPNPNNTRELFAECRKKFPKLEMPKEPFLFRQWVDQKVKKMEISTRLVDPEVTAEAKMILDIFGILWIEADGEAESLCVDLCCCGKVDGVLSNDSDVLAYAGERDVSTSKPLMLFSNLNLEAGTVEFVSKQVMLEECELSEESFRDFCILLGCDYTQHKRLKGFGPVHAYDIISQYKCIEAFIEGENMDESLVESVTIYKRCRELFTVRPCGIKIISNNELQQELLINYLTNSSTFWSAFDILREWNSNESKINESNETNESNESQDNEIGSCNEQEDEQNERDEQEKKDVAIRTVHLKTWDELTKVN